MSKLVIVESPAKAKTIKKYLGKDFEVVASMGHVRDLPQARLSVDINNNFSPRYEIIKGKEIPKCTEEKPKWKLSADALFAEKSKWLLSAKKITLHGLRVR